MYSFTTILCYGQTDIGTHSYEIYFENYPIHRTYTFHNAPADMQYIQSFPKQEMLNNSKVKGIDNAEEMFDRYFNLTFINSDKSEETLELRYYVYSIISDAEFFTICMLYNTTAVWINAIGTERDGNIGDNCWYNGTDTAVIFIRNNVWVYVTEKEIWSNANEYFEAIELAEIIDSLLVNSPIEHEPNQFQAPVINSVNTDITKQIDENENPLNRLHYLIVNAFDPQGQKLTYRPLWGGPSSISYDGSLRVRQGMIPTTLDRLYIRILVWNEDNIVSGYNYSSSPPR